MQKKYNLQREDPEQRFCVCRRGYDLIAGMVSCDVCDEWFHNECVGLPKHISASQMAQYVCVVCARMRDVTCEKLEALLRCRRIKEPELELLLREEKDLPIAATREFKALNEFRGLIAVWRESCEEELKRGVDLDQLEELTGRKGEKDAREERLRGLYLGTQ